MPNVAGESYLGVWSRVTVILLVKQCLGPWLGFKMAEKKILSKNKATGWKKRRHKEKAKQDAWGKCKGTERKWREVDSLCLSVEEVHFEKQKCPGLGETCL